MSVIEIAGWISGFTTIFVAVSKVYRLLTDIESKFDNYDITLKQNTIYILKLALLDDNMPLSDRIHAGEQYIALGGNGYGKIVYEKLLKELEEEMNK